MVEVLNNPVFIGVPLSAVILIGTWFLLRWAVNGPKQIAIGSMSVGLCLMFVVAFLFGKPNWPMGFGAGSLLAALGVATFFSMLNAISVKSRVMESAILLSAVWILLGMPKDGTIFLNILTSFLILAIGTIGFLIFSSSKDEDSPMTDKFVFTLLLSLCGHFYALIIQDFTIIAFSGILFFVVLVLRVLTFIRFEGVLSQNAFAPIYVSIGFLFWWLWFYGNVPIISLACLIMVPSAKSVVKPLLESYEGSRQNLIYTFGLMGISMLPIILSVVFFFIFKST